MELKINAVVMLFVLCFGCHKSNHCIIGFIDKHKIIASSSHYKVYYESHLKKRHAQMKRLDSIYYLIQHAQKSQYDSIRLVQASVWQREDELLSDLDHYFHTVIKEEIWLKLQTKIKDYATKENISILIDSNKNIMPVNQKVINLTLPVIQFLKQNESNISGE